MPSNDTMGVLKRRQRRQVGPTTADRFWVKVKKTDTCWIWTANKTPEGYGTFWNTKRLMPAHRWAYEQCVGEIPAGLVLDHKCRIRNCVRPDHLEPVTDKENLRRGIGPAATNAVKTVCLRGHEYTKENTVIKTNGTRRCRTCKRERDRRVYAARKAMQEVPRG